MIDSLTTKITKNLNINKIQFNFSGGSPIKDFRR